MSVLAGVASVYVIKDGSVTQQEVELGIRQGDQAYGLWRLTSGRRAEAVKVRGNLSSNDGEVDLDLLDLKIRDLGGTPPAAQDGPAVTTEAS